jgi:hypothetical protein
MEHEKPQTSSWFCAPKGYMKGPPQAAPAACIVERDNGMHSMRQMACVPRHFDSGLRGKCGPLRPRLDFPQVDYVQAVDAQRQTGGLRDRRSVSRWRRMSLYDPRKRRTVGRSWLDRADFKTFRLHAGSTERSSSRARSPKVMSFSPSVVHLYLEKCKLARCWFRGQAVKLIRPSFRTRPG